MKTINGVLSAGFSEVDISPVDSQFLFGYPYVERYSTGIHDPLLSCAFYVSNRETQLLLIANDAIFVSRETACAVRKEISKQTGIPEGHILISASHTHSGPITVDYASNVDDAAVPRMDPGYLRILEKGIVAAGVAAYENRTAAEIAFAHADSTGVGTNRRNPDGPAHHEMPVVAVRNTASKEMLGIMLVCSMHPTVLHEDSTLVTADFPGFARQYLKDRYAGCPVVYHTGACGNLSPRHVTTANTFKEAERLGTIVGSAVGRALAYPVFMDTVELSCASGKIDPVARSFPSMDDAERRVVAAEKRFAELKQSGTPQEARGAEVDLFGARETLTLSKVEASGVLEEFRQARSPVEIQGFRMGPFFFTAWPGEVFVEYALELKSKSANAFVISLANGELQGYIVTKEAAAEGGYEASNALFAPETGKRMLEESLRLLKLCSEGD
ncbi:MAG: neutral/alkaline non-lysosomal ceramidase N-terminal domain-containing protein [Kiritimatiellales bacterium]|nr:neutral/alkaline non-lysosomal ceramidase N-terminal domain-containing protein [Kiritimatiellales bacterium]